MSAAAQRDAGWRFHFHRFDAVDHKLNEVDLRWRFNPSQISTSVAELAMLTFWKAAYRLRRQIRSLEEPLHRTILDVYLGTRLPKSDLRSQIALLRNDSQYKTAGAGIDVGYAPDAPVPEWAPLAQWFTDVQKRLHMQMYLKVTSRTELRGKRVLEVGCGQGDGAAFLTQVRPPAKYVGVDLHPTQIALCGARYARLAPTLVFHRGDAQQLPLKTGVFDVAINVESSHSYPMFDRFAAEVFRVLAPGGVFCFSDLRQVPPGESCGQRLRGQFEQAGFIVDHHEDITGNAWRSLDELRDALGGQLWPEFESLRDLFGQRKFEYHHLVLRKPASAH
ncbi:MAG TPA: class I SAM-dependent methyltransferase [Vicinamibacterales bacterium]|nr:class I SAM-dependent methyltransferase [Vicinamibacterales bacterium]